jgi:hypothetical protein
MVGAGVGAFIARIPVLVADLHRAAAGAAEHDPLAQRAAFAGRAGPGVGPVGGQLRLVGQVGLPGDVTGVVAGDQHFPLAAGQLGDRGAHQPVRVDDLAGAAPPEHIRPGVCRVPQDPGSTGMGEPAPPQLPGPHPAIGAARETPAGERPGHPVSRPGGGERGEHVADHGGDLLVRVDDHGVLVVVDEPDRQRDAQLAAAGGSPLGLVHPAGQPVQLCFAHLALKPEKEPVVDVGQLIDAVAVDDQGGCQAGQLQQAGQVGVGAGKPGDLQPEHRPDLAQAHPGDQLLEPFPVAGAAAGQAQVGVDDLDVAGRPAQPRRQVGQPVLAGGGLGVLADLHQGRLADIHDRGALQVGPRHLLLAADHRRSPPGWPAAWPRARPRPCWPAGRPARRAPPGPGAPAAQARRPPASASPAPGGPAAPG